MRVGTTGRGSVGRTTFKFHVAPLNFPRALNKEYVALVWDRINVVLISRRIDVLALDRGLNTVGVNALLVLHPDSTELRPVGRRR